MEYKNCGGYNYDLSSLFPYSFGNIVCSSDFEELLCGYKNYRPLWDSSEPHFLCGVRSQMNLCGWRELLTGGPDKVFGDHGMDPDCHFLLDGMVHGFKLVDPYADIHGYFCRNYESATISAYQEINDIFTKELDTGKLSVVNKKPTCVHAMGAVPKSSGGYRPITDASKPDNFSINNYMVETFSTFSYKSIDMVAEEMSPFCFMAVTDVTAAYRSICVRPCDRPYQGLQWSVNSKNVFIQDNCISFGTRVAPFLFTRITDAIARFVNASGYFCVNYLDDFLVMGNDYETCRAAQLFLHNTLRRVGFYISYGKVRCPSQVQIYLGVELDSTTMQLRLPQEKLSKLAEEIAFFDGRRRATRKQLQRLCGILSHCSTLVRGGRTFSHRVIGLLSRFSAKRRYINLTKSFQADLDWWKEFASWFNGSAKIIQPAVKQAWMCSDASGVGYGRIRRERLAMWPVVEEHQVGL